MLLSDSSAMTPGYPSGSDPRSMNAGYCDPNAIPFILVLIIITKPEYRDCLPMHVQVLPWAFRSMLGYLYTGSLEAHIDQIEDILRLAKQCHLDALIEELEAKMKKVISFGKYSGQHSIQLGLKSFVVHL